MHPTIPTTAIATALASLRERLRLAREHQDAFQEGLALLELGTLAQSCADESAAYENLTAALVCFTSIRNTSFEADTLNLLAALEQERGSEDAALVHYRRVLTELASQAELPARGVALLAVGTLLLERGNAPLAREWLDEALAFYRKLREPRGELRARLASARAYEAQLNLDAAEDEARTVLLQASELRESALVCEARATLGRLIGLRSPARGRELLQESVAEAVREGLSALERSGRVSLAELLHREGAHEEAYRALVAAYGAERTAARAERARFQAYLAAVTLREPKRSRATQTTSLESLRMLLREGNLASRALGVAQIEIDHVAELQARFGVVLLAEVRERVCRLLQLSLRSDDIFARHGSEGYVIALPGATPRQARRIAERLRETAAKADWTDLHPDLGVTLSVGICISASGRDPDAVIEAASQGLAEARSGGANQIAVVRAAA